MNRRAQGISLNYIVIAAIAVLVLVIVVGFATGGLGKSFRNLGEAGPGESAVFKSTCESSCATAQTIISSAGWNTSDWCTKTINVNGATSHCPDVTSCTPPDNAGWTCPSEGA